MSYRDHSTGVIYEMEEHELPKDVWDYSPLDKLLDLGHDHWLQFSCWSPDRDLNPQYDGIPDVEKFGAIIYHNRPDDGRSCKSAIHFEGEVQAKIAPDYPRWQVHSWEPLTISPSLLCKNTEHIQETGGVVCECGDHGFIRNGRWEPA